MAFSPWGLDTDLRLRSGKQMGKYFWLSRLEPQIRWFFCHFDNHH
jgi:hypothetical protein